MDSEGAVGENSLIRRVEGVVQGGQEEEYVTFEGMHLKLRPDTPLDVCVAVLVKLLRAAECLQFWVGDAYIQSKEMHGDLIYQGLAAKDYEKHTIQNWASVARSIPASRRRSELDYSHHAAVTALPPEAQDEILEQAVQFELSVAKTNELKKAYEMAPYGEPEQIITERCKQCYGTGSCPACSGKGEVVVP